MTLFQQSISRAITLENDDIQIEEILIVSNENHRFLVLEQLDELKLKTPVRILLEPEPKNTAPALTLAALGAQETNPDSVLVVTPADHYVEDLKSFVVAMHEAIQVTGEDTIVTLGINPTRPYTGFGYIHFEGEGLVKNVLIFKEKPDYETAQRMIDQGQHAWNGGILFCNPRPGWMRLSEVILKYLIQLARLGKIRTKINGLSDLIKNYLNTHHRTPSTMPSWKSSPSVSNKKTLRS